MDSELDRDNDPVSQNGYTYAKNNPMTNVDPDGNFAWEIVYFIPVIGEYAAGITLIGLGGYAIGYGVWHLTRKAKAYFMSAKREGPIGKANRKQQGRENNEKKRKKPNFKSRSNKDLDHPMKKHTPSRSHQKGRRK